MKKILATCFMLLALTACTNDDKYEWESDFADRTDTDTLNIAIAYNTDNSVSVSGDDNGYVSTDGTNVVVRSNANRFMQLTLSGSATNGSLLVYSWKKYGIRLNGLTLTNANGPAINNQCGKALIITTVDGTTNTLTDSLTYTEKTNDKGESIDQKGVLFSEGQVYLRGNGTLNINGKAKNGLATDDYIVMEGGTVNINVAETGSNGVKANDGVTISGGTLNITVKAKGARGIKNEAKMTVSGGETTITTLGDCLIETLTADDGTVYNDTTSAAGIKNDSLFAMTGGTMTITSKGDGGKGINCSQNIEMSGGTLTVTTEGESNDSKPKAVKSDTGIILSGGSFKADTNKSWACDNGYEGAAGETEAQIARKRVTIIGTPTETKFKKKHVIVKF